MTENLFVSLVICPRIKQPNPKVHEILHIPSHEDQLMLNGYRCDLGIGCGWGASGTIALSHEAPPDRGRAAVERQDAPVELPGKVLFDPSLKSFATLLLPYLPSAPNELSDDLSGKEEIRRILRFDPVEHRLPGSWPDGLTDNIGVQYGLSALVRREERSRFPPRCEHTRPLGSTSEAQAFRRPAGRRRVRPCNRSRGL